MKDGGGELVRREACPFFHGVKLFSATKANDRSKLSEKVTAWLIRNQHVEVVDYKTHLSSDSEFHCVCIWIFFRATSQEAVKSAAKADERDSSRHRS